jgi:hypothetical protein
MDTNESMPEWDFFARIEELESLEPKVEDNFILAANALLFGFVALAGERPKAARKLKDLFIAHLEETNLSRELLKELSRILTIVCDGLEK